MSDFKIIGNPNPIVGVEEFYTVSDVIPSVLPYQNTVSAGTNNFELPVKWEVYVLENRRWRKTKENDKTGKKISYTFFQKSLTRKGIRILAKRGEETARLDIKTQSAQKPKINDIDLLDKNGKKPAKPLSYGQTLKVRIHCVQMERRTVYATLWEESLNGQKNNPRNIIETLPGTVKNGIAEIDFLLKPSQGNIGSVSKIHKYYVTADFKNDKITSKNVDVTETEIPIEPYKGKTTPIQPAKKNTPVQQPKANNAGDSKAVTGKITSVHLTDTAGNLIKGVFKEKQIRVLVHSTGLIGKKIRLKLFDHDYGSPNDLLFDQNFIIKADHYAIVVPLDTIPRSLGGGNLTEGTEQELFADVQVENTDIKGKSKIVDVDGEVFKQDAIDEVVNKVLKIFIPDEKDEKKENNCVCQEYDLVWGNKFTCDERKKVVQICSNLWGEEKKKQMANQLMICIALETAESFTASKGFPNATGLVQFTDSALQGMNQKNKYNKGVQLTRERLSKMTVLEQLEYVELYFRMWIDFGKIIKDSLDMYMCIWCPAAVGQEDNFICYSEEKDKDAREKDPKAIQPYSSNKSIDGEYYQEKGNIILIGRKDKEIRKEELKPRLKVKEVSGKLNRVSIYECNNSLKKGNCIDTWDNASNLRIKKLHPKIQCAVKNFINDVEASLGIKLRIIQGYRTYEEQNDLYAQGRTKSGSKVTNAKGGESNHNFGLAIDVAEVKNGTIDWEEQEVILPQVAPIGKKWGFDWGGDWKSFKDKPHFEMVFGKTTNDLRELYKASNNDYTKIIL